MSEDPFTSAEAAVDEWMKREKVDIFDLCASVLSFIEDPPDTRFQLEYLRLLLKRLKEAL